MEQPRVSVRSRVRTGSFSSLRFDLLPSPTSPTPTAANFCVNGRAGGKLGGSLAICGGPAIDSSPSLTGAHRLPQVSVATPAVVPVASAAGSWPRGAGAPRSRPGPARRHGSRCRVCFGPLMSECLSLLEMVLVPPGTLAHCVGSSQNLEAHS